MAPRIKFWSRERVIQNLEIHYHDGYWGLGLYSGELGNEVDPYDEDFYYCFVPYPELEEVLFSLYRLFEDRNKVIWAIENMELKHWLYDVKGFYQKALELGKQMNACLRGEGSPLVEPDWKFQVPDLGNPNCPLERK